MVQKNSMIMMMMMMMTTMIMVREMIMMVINIITGNSNKSRLRNVSINLFTDRIG